MKRRVKRVHFVGIGGAGTSGLAEILHASGYRVSGSDRAESATTRRLAASGIRVDIGHDASAVAGADVAVFSAAVPATNVELRAAEAARIPAISRAEMLAELMRLKHGVAVSGSHGKTTTASLAGEVLDAGGLDPTVVVGGRVRSLGANSRLGAGDVLVAEADESDGSFLRLAPTLVVVTGIDREHLDHYGRFERLLDAFADFAGRVPFYGAAIVCSDDPNVQTLLPRLGRRVRGYGLSPQADLRATRIVPDGLGTRFVAHSGGRELGEVRLGMPGEHNVANALAALAVGEEFDVPFERAREALERFAGVARRFELLGERAGVRVIDDYAHHPTEIRATLRAARSAFDGRLAAVFQPHRYTRTRDVFEDLSRAFHQADRVWVLDIYGAGEPKLPGVSAQDLAEAVRARGHRAVEYAGERAELLDALPAALEPGDALVFMGAGDVGSLAREFLDAA